MTNVFRKPNFATFALFIFSLLASPIFAQKVEPAKKDSLNERYPRYPLLKIASISYDYAGQSDYKIKYKDAPDESGEFSRGRMQAYLWLPFYRGTYFTWSVTEIYTREDYDLKNVVNPSGTYVSGRETLEDFNTMVNMNWRTKIGTKQFVVNASAMVGSSPAFRYQKVSGQVYGLVILKDVPNTIYSVGAAVLIDPSSPLPVVPVAQYWHRFENKKWEVDIVVPQWAKIRRSETLGGWLSAGAEFASQSFFIRNLPGQQSTTYENAFSEITPNIGYDNLLFGNLMLTVQGGYRINMGGRLGEVNDPARDKIANIDFGSGWYGKAMLTYVIPNKAIRQTLDKAMN
ncbi:hypothetical protein [Flavobacterium sp.]|uniref:hypothetical protein n=1 Tax=Flavobacterium sp. TaxID=239 RepID=UPI0012164FF3|nr:hypothetical protein [Flavobacterium sp.]RZJ70388.1 MAG: hypothetical protein EOO49_13995 [Flavobacterium sp.]